MVDEFEFSVSDIVVDGLRNADRLQLQASFSREECDFVGGVHGVVAAVIEEITNVVCFEDFDDAFEVFVLPGLELVTASSD